MQHSQHEIVEFLNYVDDFLDLFILPEINPTLILNYNKKNTAMTKAVCMTLEVLGEECCDIKIANDDKSLRQLIIEAEGACFVFSGGDAKVKKDKEFQAIDSLMTTYEKASPIEKSVFIIKALKQNGFTAHHTKESHVNLYSVYCHFLHSDSSSFFSKVVTETSSQKAYFAL